MDTSDEKGEVGTLSEIKIEINNLLELKLLILPGWAWYANKRNTEVTRINEERKGKKSRARPRVSE